MSQAWRKAVMAPSASIGRALRAMTGPEGSGIVLVRGPRGTLAGVVADSDIRRGLLRGVTLTDPVSKVMNPRPFTLDAAADKAAVARALREQRRAYIPLVNRAGRLAGLARMVDHLPARGARPNWVVLLVGGYGRRLGPLTKDRPKPLLPVGDKPILETIVEQFAAQGFRRFAFAVHHKAEQILEHFGSGRRLGVEIRYLREPRKLGTAGPLSLMPRGTKDPVVVMNGDLLTKVDFEALLDFHREEGCAATLCVREYDFQVPFGVVKMDGLRMAGIVEKPVHRFFVNAGIYVIEPGLLGLLAKGRRCDMPDFLERVRRKKPRAVGCFPIREYWLDIGRVEEYRRAQAEYGKFF